MNSYSPARLRTSALPVLLLTGVVGAALSWMAWQTLHAQEQAQALASNAGLSLPSERDFEALLQLYPSPAGAFASTFDLDPYWVWGQPVGAGTAVYLDLYDGLITSGRASEFELGYPAGIR